MQFNQICDRILLFGWKFLNKSDRLSKQFSHNLVAAFAAISYDFLILPVVFSIFARGALAFPTQFI